MTIVLFHSGNTLPEFLKYNFRQLRLFNPLTPIYFITDSGLMDSPLFNRYKIEPINKDLYYSESINCFNVLYGRGENDFWTITATRLIYIANFMHEQNIKNVFHFENDVLLYFNLKDYEKIFYRLYNRLAVTIGGPDKVMTGFMFIKNFWSLHHMTNFFINLLMNNKLNELKKIYGMDMVNEMTLMRVYRDEYPGFMRLLPILPFGEFAENYEDFESIFDPASWGQFVGGTPSEGPGAKPEDHYIGQLLRQHTEFDVIWKHNKYGKIPYFKYDSNEVKINNLHIHSKNLNLYIS